MKTLSAQIFVATKPIKFKRSTGFSDSLMEKSPVALLEYNGSHYVCSMLQGKFFFKVEKDVFEKIRNSCRNGRGTVIVSPAELPGASTKETASLLISLASGGKPIDEKLWRKLVEKAKLKFDWPSKEAQKWVRKKYIAKGGKFSSKEPERNEVDEEDFDWVSGDIKVARPGS